MIEKRIATEVIRVCPDTKGELDKMRKYRQTYDDIIRELLRKGEK